MPDLSIMQSLAARFGEDLVLEMASSYIKSVMDRRSAVAPRVQLPKSDLPLLRMEAGQNIKYSVELQTPRMPKVLHNRYPTFL